MKVYTSVVASALGLTAVIADPSVFRRLATDPISYPDGLTKIPSTDAFHMQPVRAIHARVQSDEPAWDDTKKMFVSKYGADFDAKFRGALDTVNTASVEGALMYVQAEGIDYRTRGSDTTAKCTRKNGMKYVVFYDILIAQTNETLAAYPNAEYGPMLPMDGGQCTPTSTSPTNVFPNECLMINGDNNKPVIGPFVGAGDKSTDSRAPYPNTFWYSFPNTCPLQKWSDKTDTCRSATRRGLCAYDTMPDGVTCTYNYRILGYVALDDVVGITAMDNSASTGKYADFAAFCADNGVEFQTNPDGSLLASIPFWSDPTVASKNAGRATDLVQAYADLQSGSTLSNIIADAAVTNFKVLPDVATLTAANPPCYKSVKACADAAHGCKRTLYSQTCTVCNADAAECVKKDAGYTYPTLAAGTPIPTPAPVTPAPSSTALAPTTPAPSAASPLVVASTVLSLAVSVMLM
ncbi:hypothetical protein Poli38472_003065 [Pythium oligandrum]|uniref:Uncharacterized protein n=1 Tax=Pythium oligandrum TaxID=41045 RepID=A0A8K1C6B6_PYTOL|nr:hypothetical protein Poli38472_003065 [Pythium oligandrum]|eukprot:TMW57140.1 hypothetical protein Poli38472_003065 [Pythium oligandrum]